MLDNININNEKVMNNNFKCENVENLLDKNLGVRLNSKQKVFNDIIPKFQGFEFFNVVSGNVFNRFLGVGQVNFHNIDNIMKSNLEGFEYTLLSFLLRFESGVLNDSEILDFIENNSFFKNLYFFLTLLKNVSWEQFCQFSDNLNKISGLESNFTLMALDSLKKILNLKNLIKSLSKGLISEGHFEVAIKKYRLNRSLASLELNNKISKYFNNFNSNKLDFLNIFSNVTIGYYDAVIDKYSKYFFFSGNRYKKDLSLVLKKRRWVKLNANKSSGSLTYAHSLALAYIGNPLILPFAPKPINLRYRAYRIFLYAFKLKPFKLWQLTRRSRDYKYGGLLVDHLSKYELTIKNILLLSNFCLDLDEVKYNLRNQKICVNGKIIMSESFVIKPFDLVHFNVSFFREERNKFLLNLASAHLKNIFKNEFSQLFEYNFKIFSFLMLPGFFKYKRGVLAPYYTIYNSGRFRIQKN